MEKKTAVVAIHVPIATKEASTNYAAREGLTVSEYGCNVFHQILQSELDKANIAIAWKESMGSMGSDGNE